MGERPREAFGVSRTEGSDGVEFDRRFRALGWACGPMPPQERRPTEIFIRASLSALRWAESPREAFGASRTVCKSTSISIATPALGWAFGPMPRREPASSCSANEKLRRAPPAGDSAAPRLTAIRHSRIYCFHEDLNRSSGRSRVMLMPRNPPPTRRPPGFTLVELLVVIAIIALLASLLLPALASAKSLARSAKCKSNLRQMGIALRLYVDDYGAYPPYNERGVDFRWRWTKLIVPYLSLNRHECSGRSDVVYMCPDYKGEKYLCVLRYGAYSGSYAMNFGGTDNRRGLSGRPIDPQANVAQSGLPETAVRTPSQMITILDSHLFPGAQGDLSGLEWTSHKLGRINMAKAVSKKAMERRHRGFFNVLFADGHIESLSAKRLFENSREARRLWNRDNAP